MIAVDGRPALEAITRMTVEGDDLGVFDLTRSRVAIRAAITSSPTRSCAAASRLYAPATLSEVELYARRQAVAAQGDDVAAKRQIGGAQLDRQRPRYRQMR